MFRNLLIWRVDSENEILELTPPNTVKAAKVSSLNLLLEMSQNK